VVKDRRRLEGFSESFPCVLASVVEVKRDVLPGEHRKGSSDATVVLNKPAVEVTETKVALYTSYIAGVSPVLNHADLFRVYLYAADSNYKS
jgi:hypothetical protein